MTQARRKLFQDAVFFPFCPRSTQGHVQLFCSNVKYFVAIIQGRRGTPAIIDTARKTRDRPGDKKNYTHAVSYRQLCLLQSKRPRHMTRERPPFKHHALLLNHTPCTFNSKFVRRGEYCRYDHNPRNSSRRVPKRCRSHSKRITETPPTPRPPKMTYLEMST